MKRNELNGIVDNVRASFSLVRDDITKLNNDFNEIKRKEDRMWEDQNQLFYRLKKLEERQREILAILSSLSLEDKELKKPVYVGNKKTGEFHEEDCILARGTDSENKLIFENAFDAKRRGFNECICLY